MPEVSNLTFDLKEVAEALVRSAGVTDGHWMLNFNLGFTVGSFQNAEDSALPGAILTVQSIAISKVDPSINPPNLVVDAKSLSSN